MSLYLLVLLFSLSIPLLFSFHPKIQFYKFFYSTFLALFSSSIFFIIWDIWFTKMQVWGFNKKYHSDFIFFNLPIEEVLFFFIIPFCCLFTYFVFRKFKIFNFKIKKPFIFIFILLLVFLIVMFYQNKYTLSVCVLSLIILFHILSRDMWWHGYFFSTYFVISFIPFILVNGILTGFITDAPPVWYDINHIIGLRLGSIPIEDFLYNFILLYFNFFLFELYNLKLNFIKFIK